MSTLKTINIAHPSSVSNNIVLDSSGNVVLQAGTAASPALQASGDTNTGVLFPAADTIALSTGGSERARCDSSGRLLIGTSSATANGGVLQVSNGVTFPATQSACSDANTLDDYEEGTFTSTIYYAGGNYSQGGGLYTKIGRQVFFSLSIYYNAGAGTTNNLTNFTVPLASAASGDNYGIVGSVFLYNMNSAGTASVSIPGFVSNSNSNVVNMYVGQWGAFETYMRFISTASYIKLNGHYVTA